MAGEEKHRTAAWPVFIVIGILVVFSVIFVVEFINLGGGSEAIDAGELTADTYLSVVEPLLVDANAANGPALLEKHICVTCHMGAAAENRVAPDFAGIADRADSRHPPLSAAAYIYESIIYPNAFEVAGYSGQMPQNYPQDIPDDELGDIIAYLLTLDEAQ